jgi:hypothetical protein
MRSFKPIGYLLVVVLFVGLVVSGAFAERPRTTEIKDIFMWGDPDELAGCRQRDVEPRAASGPSDCEMLPSAYSQVAELLCLESLWFSLRVSFQRDTAFPASMARGRVNGVQR